MEQTVILVATYPFKGTYTSAEAGQAIARELEVLGRQVEVVPLGDGGAGTLDALISGGAGSYRRRCTTRQPVAADEALWGMRNDGTAIIEAARLVGLAALPEGRRDALGISTSGIGELILAADRQGCRQIWIGLGDTATHDLGLGMASALGYRFLDEHGRELEPLGRSLDRLACIDRSSVHELVGRLPVSALCDVLNPLLGSDGAARRFLRQKGGNDDDIERMELAAERYLEIIRRDLGISLDSRSGSGAAGGLGAGIAAFLRGELIGGADAVLDAVGLDEVIARADLVITGEGRVDRGTLLGKGAAKVVARANAAGIPALVVAGSIEGDREELERGIGARVLAVEGDIGGAGGRLRDLVGGVRGWRAGLPG